MKIRGFKFLSIIVLFFATVSMSLGVYAVVKKFFPYVNAVIDDNFSPSTGEEGGGGGSGGGSGSSSSGTAGTGSGTSLSPFLIGDENSFNQFITNSLAKYQTYYGKVINDFSVHSSGLEETFIAQSKISSQFPLIILDGNYKKITYSRDVDSYWSSTAQTAVGLFGWLVGCEIKNLYVEGYISYVKYSESNQGTLTALGGLVGGVISDAVITNCHVNVDFYFEYAEGDKNWQDSLWPQCIGGIIGSASWCQTSTAANVTLKNCSYNGEVYLYYPKDDDIEIGYYYCDGVNPKTDGDGRTRKITNCYSRYEYFDNEISQGYQDNGSSAVTKGFSYAYSNASSYYYVNGDWDNMEEPYDYGGNPNITWLQVRNGISPYTMSYTAVDASGNAISGACGSLGYVVDSDDCWTFDSSSNKVKTRNFGVTDITADLSSHVSGYTYKSGSISVSGKAITLTLVFDRNSFSVRFITVTGTTLKEGSTTKTSALSYSIYEGSKITISRLKISASSKDGAYGEVTFSFTPVGKTSSITIKYQISNNKKYIQNVKKGTSVLTTTSYTVDSAVTFSVSLADRTYNTYFQ